MFTKVWVGLQHGIVTMYRPVSLIIFLEKFYHSLGKIIRDLPQGEQISRTGRMFNFKIIAIVVMKPI